jgi:hypothetical protein
MVRQGHWHPSMAMGNTSTTRCFLGETPVCWLRHGLPFGEVVWFPTIPLNSSYGHRRTGPIGSCIGDMDAVSPVRCRAFLRPGRGAFSRHGLNAHGHFRHIGIIVRSRDSSSKSMTDHDVTHRPPAPIKGRASEIVKPGYYDGFNPYNGLEF